jgi:two-component system, chemotaxis family, sensor kinase CheA
MNFEDEMKAALETFVVESRELLQDMEDHLLGLEHDEHPNDAIGAIFRAAHTIKGSSGLFGLEHIVHFTHVVESVLDMLRNHEISVSTQLIATLLPARDHIADLVEAVAKGKTQETASKARKAQQSTNNFVIFLTDHKVTRQIRSIWSSQAAPNQSQRLAVAV